MNPREIRSVLGGIDRHQCDAVAMNAIGRVEVVCGPMFAGKTEELLRRVRRALIAGRRVVVFTHALDTRHGDARLASHVGLEVPAVAVSTVDALEPAIPEDTDIVAIDEAQFFGPALVPVVGRLADRGLVVIVAGLDVTFDGRPFEPLPSLMALAEQVDKLTAICTICGEEAVFHVRLGGTSAGADALVEANVGGSETYQARCRRHFEPSNPTERG
jgi:thymidine kinase